VRWRGQGGRESPAKSIEAVSDALDESSDAVHGIAIVRHDAAHAPLHVHQPPVAACEQQLSAFARAVVSEGNLHRNHA